MLDLKAGFNFTERVSIDTNRKPYNWRGEVIRIQNQAGEFGEVDHLITTSQNYFARQQINYNFSKKHQVKLALAPTLGPAEKRFFNSKNTFMWSKDTV